MIQPLSVWFLCSDTRQEIFQVHRESQTSKFRDCKTIWRAYEKEDKIFLRTPNSSEEDFSVHSCYAPCACIPEGIHEAQAFHLRLQWVDYAAVISVSITYNIYASWAMTCSQKAFKLLKVEKSSIEFGLKHSVGSLIYLLLHTRHSCHSDSL